jgi:flagellar basal-body rod modification protein FlgD
MAQAVQSTTTSQFFQDLQTKPQERVAKKEMDKDDFLKLLTFQMKAQNPMKPQDGQQYAAQLAQFTSLEQLTNIRKLIEQQGQANNLLTQTVTNAGAPGFIGKSIRAASSTINFDGTKPVQFGYNLPLNASSVKIDIKTPAGVVIRSIQASPDQLRQGDYKLQWDGKNANGATVMAGDYNLNITAKDADGKLIGGTNTFNYGMVTGVRYRPTGTVVIVNGAEVPMSNIEEII